MKNLNIYKAWRSLGNSVAYVETVEINGKGDRYSYTDKVDNAIKLSESQAKAFCSYMKQCDTIGFYN
jgi:hypothetical protein